MKFGQWIGLVALLLALYILWQIQQLLLLGLVAVVFATALNRLVQRLERSGMKRGAAALLSSFCVLTLLLLAVAIIVPPFAEQLQQLVQLVPQGFTLLERWTNGLLLQLPREATQYLPSIGDLIQQIQPLFRSIANNFFQLFSSFFNVALSVLFIVVLTIMLVLNPTAYRHGFLRLFPSFYRRRADEILTLCEIDLMGWIIGTLINMVVIGTASGIALSILGVKLVFANALLAGLFEAIPNLGPFLSTVAPTGIALLDSPLKAVGVIIAYILIQQLEQFLLVPIVMGRQVALLPAITLLAQLAFASFFGFLGLFLAIPLVIIVRVLLREVIIKDVMDRWQGYDVRSLSDTLFAEAPQCLLPAPEDATPSPEEGDGAKD